MTNKLTLIIDGNWLLISRLVCIANKYDNIEELCDNLKVLLIRSIKLAIKQFPQIDNIIFVSDGGSWRSTLEIPDFLKDINGNIIEYKGNREKPLDVDWDSIWTAYDEFINTLRQYDINVYKEQNLEGDDLIYWWSKELNQNNINCIIWSSDNDLKQLVNINKNKCFCVWWNKNNGLYVKDFDETDLDFLFNNDFKSNNILFNEITNHMQINKINANSIIINKIIRGDAGDNIEPILYKQSPKSTRKYKVANADIDYLLNWENDDDVYKYLKNLLAMKKYSSNINKDFNDIFEHFKYNRKLVVLNESQYPKYIVDKLKNLEYHIPKQQILDSLNEIENIFNAKLNKLNGILDII